MYEHQKQATQFIENALSSNINLQKRVVEKAQILANEQDEVFLTCDKSLVKRLFVHNLAEELQASFKIEKVLLKHHLLESEIEQIFFEKNSKVAESKESHAVAAVNRLCKLKHPISISDILAVFDVLAAASNTEIRTTDVYVVKDNVEVVYAAPEPEELQKLLELFCKWVNTQYGKCSPAILSNLIHLFFVLIHPFEDGNGRMARLLALLPVINQKDWLFYATSAVTLERKPIYYSLLRDVHKDNRMQVFVEVLIDFQKEALNRLKQQTAQLSSLDTFLSLSKDAQKLTKFDKNLLQYLTLKNSIVQLSALEQDYDQNTGDLIESLNKFEQLRILYDGRISYDSTEF